MKNTKTAMKKFVGYQHDSLSPYQILVANHTNGGDKHIQCNSIMIKI